MKKSHLNIIGFVIVFFLGVGMGVSGLWFMVQNNIELRHYLLERSTVNQPQAQIAKFVRAIVQDERKKALGLWEIRSPDAESKLTRRREAIISELVHAGISPDYRVLEVEWWTTCCEPTVTCDSRSAGGARIKVQFLDVHGEPILYIFDIFTREQPYWGAAVGYPPRSWVIRDVYPSQEEPLFFPIIYETQVRYLRP